MDLNILHDSEMWKTLLITIFCGGLVGLERQLKGKPAGMRTCIFICLSIVIFMHADVSIPDKSRTVQAIITGVGFLGAGVILTKEGLIKGVTSASIIWVLAGIGITIGNREYIFAILLTFVTVGVSLGVEILEKSFARLRQGVHRWLKNDS